MSDQSRGPPRTSRAGLDRRLRRRRRALPANMVFANAASVHETSTSEMTLALILASQRGIPDFVRAAEKGHWARAWHESLADRTVLLVGYGGVGKAIETRLLAFEVTVVRVARTQRSDDTGIIHAIGELPLLLAQADIVVVVVPLTDERRTSSTTHFCPLCVMGHCSSTCLEARSPTRTRCWLTRKRADCDWPLTSRTPNHYPKAILSSPSITSSSLPTWAAPPRRRSRG